MGLAETGGGHHPENPGKQATLKSGPDLQHMPISMV